MVKYDMVYAHASTALLFVKNSMYSKEVIHFALDFSQIDEKNYFQERILMITNDAVMFI